MIAAQVLNKVLQEQDTALLDRYGLEPEHFRGYETELEFIRSHVDQYSTVPDKTTFIAEFPDWEFFEVNEPDSYLIDAINEEATYGRLVNTVQEVVAASKTDAHMAVELLRDRLPTLQSAGRQVGTDLVMCADDRLDAYRHRKDSEEVSHITTGFEELDSILYGWAMGEEFIVWLARTGQGKSWVVVKTAAHAWQLGYNVGYISPEMSATRVGYRFDTIVAGVSNMALLRGQETDGYGEHIDGVKSKDNCFVVATPSDFQRHTTVGKLRNFVIANKLDMLCIDGIGYMRDNRGGGQKTEQLMHISEDLMEMSRELSIPVHVVVQSNRGGVGDAPPGLDTIRDSDAIAHNASKAISLVQRGPGIEFAVKKHRDGRMGQHVLYAWDADLGVFEYVPSEEDDVPTEQRVARVGELVEKFGGDEADVF